MAPRIRRGRIGGLSLLCAAAVTALAAPPTSGADPAACRVRNVTQATTGRSLIRMVDKAVDTDELMVQGSCPGPVVIDVDIRVGGLGDEPTLTGRGRTLVVRVKRGATVTIRDITIQRGITGIRSRGRLTLEDVIVRRQSDRGIWNDGRMTIIGSSIRRNSDGGIFNSGLLQVTASVITRNSSRGDGGGILNNYAAQLTLTDTTISGNRARSSGGGVYNGDAASSTGGETVTLIRTTVTDNVAGHAGGGIGSNESWSVTVDADSSVVGNTPDECSPASIC